MNKGKFLISIILLAIISIAPVFAFSFIFPHQYENKSEINVKQFSDNMIKIIDELNKKVSEIQKKALDNMKISSPNTSISQLTSSSSETKKQTNLNIEASGSSINNVTKIEYKTLYNNINTNDLVLALDVQGNGISKIYYDPSLNGKMIPDIEQTWEATNGKWYTTGGFCTLQSLCSWNELHSKFPDLKLINNVPNTPITPSF